MDGNMPTSQFANSGLARFGVSGGFTPAQYTPRTYMPPSMIFGRRAAIGGGPSPIGGLGGYGGSDGGDFGQGPSGGQAGYISSGFNTGLSNTSAGLIGGLLGIPGMGLANMGINALGSASAGLHGGQDGIGISGPNGIGVGAPSGLSAAGVGAAGYGDAGYDAGYAAGPDNASVGDPGGPSDSSGGGGDK